MIMTYNCTFKLAYTTIIFNKNIDFNITPKEFKNNITNDVIQLMSINNFNIILAGHKFSEEHSPINCNNDNQTLYSLIGNSHIFYIKENNQQIHENIECIICYNIIIPQQRIILGCNHQFCRNCIALWFRTGISNCPYCRS